MSINLSKHKKDDTFPSVMSAVNIAIPSLIMVIYMKSSILAIVFILRMYVLHFEFNNKMECLGQVFYKIPEQFSAILTRTLLTWMCLRVILEKHSTSAVLSLGCSGYSNILLCLKRCSGVSMFAVISKVYCKFSEVFHWSEKNK